MKNNIFFKKYKLIKIIVLTHLVISLICTTIMVVNGYIDGNVIGRFKRNYENYIALSNPEKYLTHDHFVVDTSFIEVRPTSNMESTTTTKDYTIIRGNLLNSKIKQELICHYIVSSILEDNHHKQVRVITVLKNKINGVAFLGDKRYMTPEKDNAVASLYFLFSIIPLIIILLILKIKSK